MDREWTRRLQKLADYQLDALADAIGTMVTGSTVNRLVHDKHGPEGELWPAWSDDYAQTRHVGNSLLIGEGHMRESIQHQIYGTRDDLVVGVGVHVKQAATHQFGDESRGIPARPFLGLSADDRHRIEELVIGDLSELLT